MNKALNKASLPTCNHLHRQWKASFSISAIVGFNNDRLKSIDLLPKNFRCRIKENLETGKKEIASNKVQDYNLYLCKLEMTRIIDNIAEQTRRMQ